MEAASRERRYERAAALLRRRERLEALLGRLDGVLRAVHADPRLVLARHPIQRPLRRAVAGQRPRGRLGPAARARPTRWPGAAGRCWSRGDAGRAHVGAGRGRGRGADRLGVDGRAPPARAGAGGGGGAGRVERFVAARGGLRARSRARGYRSGMDAGATADRRRAGPTPRAAPRSTAPTRSPATAPARPPRPAARTPGPPPTPRRPPSASGRPLPRRHGASRCRRPPRCCASGRRTSPRS